MKTKLALSNAEQQEYLVNAKRLMAAGVIPREDQPASEPSTLTLEQVGGPPDSFVHALPSGGYGLGVWVRIVVLKSRISLFDCLIKPRKWDDTRIRLVDGTNGLYSYARSVGVEYPRANMLNPWISTNRYLSRGKVLEGVVMAHSPAPLPAWCVNGISVDADLIFFDQFDKPYPLEVELRIIRDTERSVERPRRTGLFGPAVVSRQRTYREEPPWAVARASRKKQPGVSASK
jgi:hypothetical protein